jgi:hypothetical protein
VVVARMPSAVEIAERSGFDMSLIEVSLGYSCDQRALQHQAALELMLEMERAGKQLPDSAQPHRSSLRR